MAFTEAGTRRFMDTAWMRDPHTNIIHTGEALVLALLVHTKGKGRASKEERELRKFMKDQNLED